MDGKAENPKVLICDDSQILNDLLKDVFESHGFEVSQAFEGHQCKISFLRENPQFTLLDIRMPKADGLDVLSFIKQRSPASIVVMMTGAGTEETAVEAMKLKADDYLNKPFDMAQVVALAKRLLDRQKSERETQRLKKEIQRTERFLAHLTNTINEGLITTDSNGRIEFINSAAGKMWGYSPQELQGKDIHFLIRGEGRVPLSVDLVRETLKEGKVEGEFLFRAKDGRGFPGYMSSSVIREGAKVRGIVILVADLTRIHEVEQRLKQTEKLASLGRVVEGIAHEVRNCLTSLGGFTQRLKKLTEDREEARKFASIILDDVRRLESMVRQIEDYVHFSKAYEFHFDKVSVVEVIHDAHAAVMQRISPKTGSHVAFKAVAEGDPPRVRADRAALEEVFFNVILNAYEAMPSGGRCDVTVKNLGRRVAVVVRDTGVGIRDEFISDIFTPFVSSKTTGAGMGLSKVYLLVDEHGGVVNVDSKPNKGTTFEIILPVEGPPAGILVGRPPGAPEGLPPLRPGTGTVQ
jgi:PAS domain S-box-containing protein